MPTQLSAFFDSGLTTADAAVPLLLQMLDGVSTPVYVKNRQHQWVYANTACGNLLGRSPQTLTRCSETDLFPIALAQQLQRRDEAQFEGEDLPPHALVLTTPTEAKVHLNRRVQRSPEGAWLLCFLDPAPPEPTAASGQPPLWNTPQFLTLLANVPAMIYQLRQQPDGEIAFAFASAGAFEVSGCATETLYADPNLMLDRIHPLDRPDFDAAMQDSARTLTSWRWEGRYYKPSGELRWLQTAARPRLEADGTLLWDGLLMDITNRKQAEAANLERAVMEQAIADNETRFRTIAATIPGALFQLRIQDQQWHLDYISDRIEAITGITADQVLANSQRWLERVHPADRPAFQETLETAIAQRQPWTFEGRLITPTGEVRWWRGDAVPLQEPQGTALLFCGVILDITARKSIENAYRESEQRLRMALEVSGMSVWTWDVASDQMTWTSGMDVLQGPEQGSFCSYFETYLQRVHPGDRQRLRDTVNRALQQEQDYQIEYRLQLSDDRERWVGERGGIWRDSEGLVVGMAGTMVDITDRKAADAALQESEERYRTLLDNIPGAVYRCRADDRWTTLFQSDAIADITGYAVDDPIHHEGMAIIHPDDRDQIDQEVKQAVVQRQSYDLEYRILHADGSIRWVQDKGQPIFDADGQPRLMDGVLTDITRRKASETRQRDLAQREALINRISGQIRESLKLETILQTTVQAIRSQLQTDRVVVYQFSENWYGRVVVEDVAKPWQSTLGEMGADNCFPNGYADCYASGRVRAIDDIREAGLESCHLAYLENLQVRANLIVPILIKHRLWGLLIAHECRGPRHWSGSEIELLLSLAGQVGVAIGQADLYRQATENATRAQQQAADLEATLGELRRTQAQLVQTEKMSSLGQLVAGVAHEINNPVSFIDGNLSHACEYTQDLLELVQLYQQALPQPPAAIAETVQAMDLEFLAEDFPKLLESMRVGADRIKNIVTSLRTFSRMDEAEIKPVDLHDGLDSTLMILQNRLKANGNRPQIQVDRQYGKLAPVECYAGQLNQVFMNLIGNAIDALESQMEQGILTAPPTITIRTDSLSGDRVSITIADNGPGIPDKALARIFEPFYTTKPVGKGTGIGLSISYQIVTERHHGTLTCESEPGHTAFVITIPQQQGTT